MAERSHIAVGACKSLSQMLDTAGVRRINKRDIVTEKQFTEFISKKRAREADYVVIWGFCDFDDKVREWASVHGVRIVYGELGWFPHYSSFHLDPEGFCWQSQLAKTPYFDQALPPHVQQLQTFAQVREKHGKVDGGISLPDGIKHPYAFWPCQLVSDRVNMYGLKCEDWASQIKHFRNLLDDDVQLVIKLHPKSRTRPSQEQEASKRLVKLAATLPNTIRTTFEHMPTLTRLSRLIGTQRH